MYPKSAIPMARARPGYGRQADLATRGFIFIPVSCVYFESVKHSIGNSKKFSNHPAYLWEEKRTESSSFFFANVSFASRILSRNHVSSNSDS
jgi:hypothetical protein